MKTFSLKNKVVLPVTIVIVGFLLMKVMVLMRSEPEMLDREYPGPLVEVLTAVSTAHPIEVLGTGTVQARYEANIAPQVSGKVVNVAEDLIAGGYFQKGDVLFEIERIDYELVLEQRKADVARAEYDLAMVESQARVARQEWERISEDNGAEPNPLVLYEPQLKNAQALFTSAEAALKKAGLDLERTQVRAPFDCLVNSEIIDRGQLVQAGVNIATLTGTNTAEVVLPLPLTELQWLVVPGPGENGTGSSATVRITVDGKEFTWPGEIVRSLGEVDPQGRMVRVVVGVKDPYGLENPGAGDNIDLSLGLFVEVKLNGTILEDVFVIPNNALRENSTVWILDERERLVIKAVSVFRREQQNVVIGEGFRGGERIILTNLTGAAEGMKVRPMTPGVDQ